jgi:hypothetical protein
MSLPNFIYVAHSKVKASFISLRDNLLDFNFSGEFKKDSVIFRASNEDLSIFLSGIGLIYISLLIV